MKFELSYVFAMLILYGGLIFEDIKFQGYQNLL